MTVDQARDTPEVNRVSPPDVTFVMAAHNVALYVAAAIESALAQVGMNVEVLVVDDASSDDTTAIVADIMSRNGRVRLLKNTRKLGPGGARNRALDEARGQWVSILDADDIVAPMRTMTLLKVAMDNDCEIVADNVLRFDSDDPGREWPLLSRRQLSGVRHIGVADFLRMNCMTRGDANLGFLKPIFSRAFLNAHQIRYDERLRIGEDFDFCLRCMSAGARYIVTPPAMYRYRIRLGSISKQLAQSDLRGLIAAHRRAEPEPAPNKIMRKAHAMYRRSLEDLLAYLDFREALRGRRLSRIVAVGVKPRLWRAVVDISIGVARRRHAVKQADKERRIASV